MKIVFFNVFTLLIILMPTSSSWASCAFYINKNMTTYDQTLPMAELVVPRNALTGAYGNVISFTAGPGTDVKCTPNNYFAMFKFSSMQTETDITNIYETDVEGLGFKVWNDSLQAPVIGNALTTWWNYPTDGKNINMASVKMQFYVTGTVSPGIVQFSGPFVEVWANTEKSETGGVRYSVMNLNSTLIIKVPTCETPNILVDMGKHKSSDFSGINSKGTEKPFNFEIKNCDPGLNSVNYTFKPATGINLQQNGTINQYITLDASSTASGVGIQVLYNDGSIVPFNSKIKYTDYQTAMGGSYTIPMKARYIQTASTVSGGTANSALEFTMSYE